MGLMPLPPSEELLELAIELEALADGPPDISSDEQVLRIIARCDVDVVLGGVVLAHLLRIGHERAGTFVATVEPSKRLELVRAMLVAQPQATARIIGAQQLRDLVVLSKDRQFHDQVAAAFEGQVVVDDEICLPVLMHDARMRLAMFLAERAGRNDGTEPAWITQLDHEFGDRALPAFCFGLLCGRLAENFRQVSMRLGRAEWSDLQKRVQSRAFELTPQGSETYIRVRDAAGLVPNENGLKLTRQPMRPTGSGSKASRARALCVEASKAGSAEIAGLLAEARSLEVSAWRREAQLALLRRALILGVRLSPFAFGLQRVDVAAEIAATRIMSGDLRRMSGKSWKRIDIDRRFQILSSVITSAAGGAHVEAMLNAVLEMPDAVRGILAERLLAVLGQSACMTDELLGRLSEDGTLSDDVLVVLARTYALRGSTVTAKKIMRKAEAQAGERRWHETIMRLKQILQCPGEVPHEVAPAVATSLAALRGVELPSALKLCRNHLAPEDYRRVVADVIVRGRAVEAFAEIL